MTGTKATLAGSAVRALLGGDRHRAGRHGLLGEMRAVGLGAGNGEKQKARLDLAAVGGNAGDIDAGKSRIDLGTLKKISKLH